MAFRQKAGPARVTLIVRDGIAARPEPADRLRQARRGPPPPRAAALAAGSRPPRDALRAGQTTPSAASAGTTSAVATAVSPTPSAA